MNRFFLLVFVLFTTYQVAVSQIYKDVKGEVLNGVLREEGTFIPIAGAKIVVQGANVEIYTDARGFFAIPSINQGGTVWLEFSAEDYETMNMPATIGGGIELGVLYLKPKFRNLNPITVNDLRAAGSDVSSEAFSEPGTAALLFGTDNILVNSANYQLGMLGLRLRGYDWKHTDVYFNGVPANEPETGYAAPLLWNGLNDAMGKAEGVYGLGPSSMLYFGNIGGASNLRIRPSEFRRQFKASYSFANSLYTHRLMATYATGAMDNGWSLLVSASGRMGNGFIEGMDYQSLSYLLVVEKEIAEDQNLMLTVLGAPTKRGMQNYSTQQAYDIAGSNYYNSAWGYDNGDKRNARMQNFHQPLISLSHDWNINDWTLLRTTAGFTFGNKSETALAWTSTAADPRPDTYDKLATSFANTEKQQISWADIYAANAAAVTVGNGAQYVLGAQHADRTTFTFNSIYDTEITDKLLTTAGVQATVYNGKFYNQVDDLLGGSYWADIDKFTPSDAVIVSPDYFQSDMNHLDRDVKAGDRFEYNYGMSQMTFGFWNNWAMGWRRWNFTAAGAASYTTFARDGYMRNGKFPDNSEGKSESQNFINFAVKGGATYPLLDNGYIEGNIIYLTRAPQFRDAYSMPQISNSVVSPLKNETVLGGELNYTLAVAYVKLKASAFYTKFGNQTRTRFHYDNDYQSLMNLSLTGVSQKHMGAEIQADLKLLPELTLKAGALYGIYKYASGASATLIQQNTATILAQNVDVHMNELKVAGTPQMAVTAGLLYDSPELWWIGGNVCYAANNYLEPNPMRLVSSLGYDADLGQEKLKAALKLDINGGYTFNWSGKFLSLNICAHNLLGSNALIGGYEPLNVIDASKPADRYAPNYAYAYGRTIFLMVTFGF